MTMKDLTQMLLTVEEASELQHDLELLENKAYSAFYTVNERIIRNILFLENLDEFLDFVSEEALDVECFCFAYLCEKQYGISFGGYEDDVRPALTSFLNGKGINSSELQTLIAKERIYTECDDVDNFKSSVSAMNQILNNTGVRLVVFEDGIYCDCEYSLLLVTEDLYTDIVESWESDNFDIYV